MWIIEALHVGEDMGLGFTSPNSFAGVGSPYVPRAYDEV
jgi:hypothetical protein